MVYVQVSIDFSCDHFALKKLCLFAFCCGHSIYFESKYLCFVFAVAALLKNLCRNQNLLVCSNLSTRTMPRKAKNSVKGWVYDVQDFRTRNVKKCGEEIEQKQYKVLVLRYINRFVSGRARFVLWIT